MNYWENQGSHPTQVAGDTSGLQQFFSQTFTWMSLGLALTGLLAVLVSSTPALVAIVYQSPFVFYGIIIAEFILVIAFTRAASRGASFGKLLGMFIAYAALNGITISWIFMFYTAASVAQTFFVTAASFGALSAYGYFTGKDLSGMGRFLFMALFGVIIALVVNYFLASPMLDFIVSIAGVLVFAGLTAYDTQRLKVLYTQYAGQEEAVRRLSLQGALILYLDFINLMLFLLRFLGNRR